MTMVCTTALYLVFWLHFVGDFIMQTDKMAINKSKSNRWLTIHVVAYSLPFLLFGWRYALVNFGLHWATDFLSSRVTSALWKAEKRHWFFVVIGFDQAIHMTCLIATMPLAVSTIL